MNTDIQIGRINTLRLTKRVDFGYYLDGGPVYGEILLPNGEVPEGVEFTHSQDVAVLIYLDQDERLVATMHRPLAQVGDFASLEVAWVNNFGAFLHWGPKKDLFVPFREQKMKMVKGQRYIVHIHLDDESKRIMASAKIEKWLNPTPDNLRVGMKVDCLVWQKTDIGFKAIILPGSSQDQGAVGVIYDNQIFRPLFAGNRISAYINKVRPDGKVDLALERGRAATDDFSDTLLHYLEVHGPTISYSDKTPAQEIYTEFGVSKKLFKRAIGDLYKRRLISIGEDSISLLGRD